MAYADVSTVQVNKSSTFAVEARMLSRSYGNGLRALDAVNLAIVEGEWLAVVGPSGSGKTTLLHLIACLDSPSEGQLLVAGVDVSRLTGKERARFRRETVGLVFQQFYLVPYLTAVENVMLAQYFHSMADEGEARAALARVGLGDRWRHLPSQLSGGEQQRLCIARALINEPSILLADEPTGNLDAESERAVLELFREAHAQGRTLIVVTHDPTVAAMADRAVRLDHGRIVGEQSESGPSGSAEHRDETAPIR